METDKLTIAQMDQCKKISTAYFPAPSESILGIATNVRGKQLPVNGLRHPPEKQTNGWYIWAGEKYSTAPDFFKPLHMHHLSYSEYPWMKFLGLPPGWRFLWAPTYQDIWFDGSLV